MQSSTVKTPAFDKNGTGIVRGELPQNEQVEFHPEPDSHLLADLPIYHQINTENGIVNVSEASIWDNTPSPHTLYRKINLENKEMYVPTNMITGDYQANGIYLLANVDGQRKFVLSSVPTPSVQPQISQSAAPVSSGGTTYVNNYGGGYGYGYGNNNDLLALAVLSNHNNRPTTVIDNTNVTVVNTGNSGQPSTIVSSTSSTSTSSNNSCNCCGDCIKCCGNLCGLGYDAVCDLVSCIGSCLNPMANSSCCSAVKDACSAFADCLKCLVEIGEKAENRV